VKTILFIIAAIALVCGVGAMVLSEKADPKERAKEGASAAVAGAFVTAGCLVQCIMAAIPVLIGLFLIGALARSCS
jgi:hypothetical protein